ncbi:PhzF family phenazine biosynthesis protein [Massilia sp. ST3]|uniref:PhzF family phenazine biosynthesis protein n=1 Tax=Massilia sp. ST3 TaxID=2824903 RepID=UPI001B823536|nr:PhzF family phenazine biosynthesis protein [Massilia sp. ST3]MBQ5949735.1 PhzF family phenazine biosynthesis protein [Massilia sp. ST3]
MKIHALQCFGARPGAGNPALVIEDDASGQEERARFARERNMTCVWIDPANEPGIAGVVDYFYPHARSPLCVHATLAVAQVLFARDPQAPSLAVRTAVRGQRLGLVHADGEFFVRMDVQEAAQPALDAKLLARLLLAPGFTPASAPRVTSIGSPKLLVEVPDTATLHALAPDLAAIGAWGKQAGVNGIYVYCRRADGNYEGRNFNHLDPALEDSATGVAAGALTALLGQGLTLLQGRATGRDCLIRTRIDESAVLVGGRVESAD